MATRARSHPYLALGRKEEKDVSLPAKLLAVVDIFARVHHRSEWVQHRWMVMFALFMRKDPCDLGICFANQEEIRVRLIRVSHRIYLG